MKDNENTISPPEERRAFSEYPKGSFPEQLIQLINKQSIEGGSNTPDYLLGEYLFNCLENFDMCIRERNRWYGNSSANNPATEIKELSASEAVFGFVSWITTRAEPITASISHDHDQWCKVLDLFCKENNLPRRRDHWEKSLAKMPSNPT